MKKKRQKLCFHLNSSSNKQNKRKEKKTRKKFYITKLFALKIEETGKFNKEYF